MHAFFLEVSLPWRSMTIAHVRLTFVLLLAHGGAAQAMPKCVHRESIGMLKKPLGTIGLVRMDFKNNLFSTEIKIVIDTF